MKILQRSINVIAVLFLAFSLYVPFVAMDGKLVAFFKVFGTGVVLVLIVNYIFLGKLTLWNSIRRDE